MLLFCKWLRKPHVSSDKGIESCCTFLKNVNEKLHAAAQAVYRRSFTHFFIIILEWIHKSIKISIGFSTRGMRNCTYCVGIVNEDKSVLFNALISESQSYFERSKRVKRFIGVIGGPCAPLTLQSTKDHLRSPFCRVFSYERSGFIIEGKKATKRFVRIMHSLSFLFAERFLTFRCLHVVFLRKRNTWPVRRNGNYKYRGVVWLCYNIYLNFKVSMVSDVNCMSFFRV